MFLLLPRNFIIKKFVSLVFLSSSQRNSYGIFDHVFSLFFSFLYNRRLLLDKKSSEEFAINTGVPQGIILDGTLFLPYINYLPDDVIWNIVVSTDDTSLY